MLIKLYNGPVRLCCHYFRVKGDEGENDGVIIALACRFESVQRAMIDSRVFASLLELIADTPPPNILVTDIFLPPILPSANTTAATSTTNTEQCKEFNANF